MPRLSKYTDNDIADAIHPLTDKGTEVDEMPAANKQEDPLFSLSRSALSVPLTADRATRSSSTSTSTCRSCP